MSAGEVEDFIPMHSIKLLSSMNLSLSICFDPENTVVIDSNCLFNGSVVISFNILFRFLDEKGMLLWL